jgi:acetyl/propionyl-CoA carboxylase alpha subunit
VTHGVVLSPEFCESGNSFANIISRPQLIIDRSTHYSRPDSHIECKQHTNNTQTTHKQHTNNTQTTHKQHTNNTQTTHKQATHQQHTNNTQTTHKQHTNNTQTTHKQHTNNTQTTHNVPIRKYTYPYSFKHCNIPVRSICRWSRAVD